MRIVRRVLDSRLTNAKRKIGLFDEKCVYRPPEHSSSYEDLTEKLEMSPTTETTALASTSGVRPKFTRQQSTMETPLDSSGVVKMTCWF